MAKPGRPELKPTKAQRQEVELLVACGMVQLDICKVVGCSEPTLMKHYANELRLGRERARARILGMLNKAARKGNVSAQKKLEELSRVVAAPAQPSITGGETARGGKKEQAQADAQQVVKPGNEWGDDLNPTVN